MPLDTEARALIDVMQSAGPPVETLTPDQARRASDARRAQAAAPVEDVLDVADRQVPTSAGPVRTRVYRPSTQSGLPLVVFFHGGGWVLCDLDSHDGLCRTLANAIGAVVLSVDYRRAPEDRFPAAVEDCYAATAWAADNAAELDIDPARIAVMGDSAGGNLAAAVALMARDRSGPALGLQVLLYPVVDDDFATSSYTRFGTDHYLTRAAMQWYWEQYVDPADRDQPYVSLLRGADLSGLPQALVLVGECDPLHDEGIAYAQRMAKDGVDVTTIDVEGGFHGFLSLGAALGLARRSLADVAVRVRTELGGRSAGT